MTPLKVILAGLGVRGRHWAEVLTRSPRTDILAYVDPNPAAIERAAAQYGEFRQGYDKDAADTRTVFYGLRYILENYVLRRWTAQVRLELAVAFCFSLTAAHAADAIPVVQTAKSGPWSTAATWVGSKVPGWLRPVPLPKDSPFKMWKVVR